MKIPVIIDTDPGHDDALAIMLAVKSSVFDIKAITTVAGNSTIENTTRNARYILKLLNREDIPVFSGAKEPLKRNLIKAVVHGESGLEGIDPQNAPDLTNDAVEQILSIIKNSNDKITLVTLGPLTNIAKAIKKSPSIMSRLKEIVIMGGALKVPGNKNRVAEFNIFVDPEAAETVFNFNVKKTLVPLDACNHVKLSLEDFQAIKNKTLINPILSMVKPYIDNIFADEGIKAALMYDPLTIYYLINPGACSLQEFDVLVETKGILTRGMTVADFRKKTENINFINVVMDIKLDEFKKDFIKYLSDN